MIALLDVADAPEVAEVAAPVAGDDGVQRVVKVVAPLRVQPQAADLLGPDHARVVEIALRDQPGVRGPRRAASAWNASAISCRIGRAEKSKMPWIASRRRPSAWYSVSQCERVVDEEAPDLVAVGPVEVQRVAPRACDSGR